MRRSIFQRNCRQTYAFRNAGKPREGRNPSDEIESLHGGRELVISRSEPYGAKAAGARERLELNGTTPSALLIDMFCNGCVTQLIELKRADRRRARPHVREAVDGNANLQACLSGRRGTDGQLLLTTDCGFVRVIHITPFVNSFRRLHEFYVHGKWAPP
jgi:hypothetical protein